LFERGDSRPAADLVLARPGDDRSSVALLGSADVADVIVEIDAGKSKGDIDPLISFFYLHVREAVFFVGSSVE
jgi:hypothetical protein